VKRTGSTFRNVLLAASALVLAGCQVDDLAGNQKHLRPLSYASQERLQNLRMNKTAPIMMRIYKQEAELEIWKQGATGKYELFKTYEICRWSGKLGPKFAEGDRQAPEGFYQVTPALMNPNSKYYLSFNLGFPNPFDRSHKRTGTHLMVHGACSSAGCYAMTDEQMQEIYIMARDAFRGGQKAFQVQAFPFRMNAENFFKHKDNEHIPFWKTLKRGHDHFEVTKTPPKLDVCERNYVFNAKLVNETDTFKPAGSCPAYETPAHIKAGVAKLDAEHDAAMVAILQDIENKRQRAEKWENRTQKVVNLLDFSKDKDKVEREDASAAPDENGAPEAAAAKPE